MPILSEAYKASRRSEVLKVASSVDPDDWKWRRVSAYGVEKAEIDLRPFTRDTAIAAAESLFLSSPLGSRMVQWILDFVVGSGFTISSPNPEANRMLRAFWNSPENTLQEKVRDYVQELAVYGELALPVGENNRTGHCSLSFIPSCQISDVIEAAGLPGVADEVVTKAEQRYKVIRWQPRENAYAGDCFFFRINRLGGHTRGHPFLLPLIDWIRIWERFSYNHLERSAHHSGVWWDVTLTGQTEDEIDAWMQTQRAAPPKPGSVFGHNELVDWKLVQAEARSRGVKDDVAFFQSFILGTAGLTHMSQLPRNVGEALDPVVKYLGSLRATILAKFSLLGKYVIQRAIEAGKLDEGSYRV